jgi:hypothetical protein
LLIGDKETSVQGKARVLIYTFITCAWFLMHCPRVSMFKRLLFGISGLPLGDGSCKFNQASAIEDVKSIGLDAMELLFVRSVTVTARNKNVILYL